jgi:hypothetical protein
MKGKYCSVYNIKIKRYTTVVRYLCGIICTMTMHGHCLHKESVISEPMYL